MTNQEQPSLEVFTGKNNELFILDLNQPTGTQIIGTVFTYEEEIVIRTMATKFVLDAKQLEAHLKGKPSMEDTKQHMGKEPRAIYACSEHRRKHQRCRPSCKNRSDSKPKNIWVDAVPPKPYDKAASPRVSRTSTRTRAERQLLSSTQSYKWQAALEMAYDNMNSRLNE